MSRAVHVYRLTDRFLVCPLHVTTAGLSIESEPYTVLPLPCTASQLGAAVEAALLLSGDRIAHPEDWKAHAYPRLRAAGVRSESALQRNAQLVTVRSSSDGWIIEPSHRGGTRGDNKGFHSLAHLIVASKPGVKSDVLGHSIDEAFAACTSGT